MGVSSLIWQQWLGVEAVKMALAVELGLQKQQRLSRWTVALMPPSSKACSFSLSSGLGWCRSSRQLTNQEKYHVPKMDCVTNLLDWNTQQDHFLCICIEIIDGSVWRVGDGVSQ